MFTYMPHKRGGRSESEVFAFRALCAEVVRCMGRQRVRAVTDCVSFVQGAATSYPSD